MLKAEEKAARLPATLTVPMMIFIMPTLFIVLYVFKFDSWFLAPEDVARTLRRDGSAPK